MVELALRAVLSLAVVVGLLWAIARFSSRRMRGGAGSLVRVAHRHQVGRGSSVAVVTVGARVLVLGVTEQQVRLLTELDPAEVAAAQAPPADLTDVSPHETGEHDPTATPGPVPDTVPAALVGSGSVLSGSVLSGQTWKQAYAAATRRLGAG